MSNNRDRLTLLGRIQKIRAIEKKLALAQLAEARATQRRRADLAHRSRAMSGDYIARKELHQAGDLTAMMGFRSKMDALADTAEQMAAEASQDAEAASNRLAAAGHRLDNAARKLSDEGSRISAKEQSRAASLAGRLARRLQNTDAEDWQQMTGEHP